METMLEVQRALGRLEAKVDTLLDHQANTHRELVSLDVRLKALEGWRWVVIGAGSAVAAVISFAFKVIDSLMNQAEQIQLAQKLQAMLLTHFEGSRR